MGNWNINIQGTGCHHNGKPDIDADLAAVEFVAKLRAQGHTVEAASFTSGGKLDLLEAAKPGNKMVRGIINGRHAELAAAMTYEMVKNLAGIKSESPSCTYGKARFGKEGILHHGESVECVDGTVFSIMDTGNA